MHILEIPLFFTPHGGAFCLDQARALQARGHEVRILSCVELCISTDKALFFTAPIGRWWEKMQGVEVYRSYQRRIPRSFRLTFSRYCRILEEMFHDYEIRYGRPDILHVHCAQFAGMAVARISEQTGIPYVITEHLPSGLYTPYFGKNWEREPWIREEIRAALEGARCVIPVAEELVEDIAPFFGKNYRYQVIGNLIDTDFFAYRARTPQANRRFRYLCVALATGDALKRKGYDVLAEAWGKFRDGELVIVGKGTDSDAMNQLFRHSQHVTLLGEKNRDEVRELLYQCDALVLASRSEVQPLVLLEAMSTGIPVVATEATPKSERIEGVCLIAKTDDADSLVQQMEKVKAIAPSPAISQAVRAIASPDVIATQLETLFQSI